MEMQCTGFIKLGNLMTDWWTIKANISHKHPVLLVLLLLCEKYMHRLPSEFLIDFRLCGASYTNAPWACKSICDSNKINGRPMCYSNFVIPQVLSTNFHLFFYPLYRSNGAPISFWIWVKGKMCWEQCNYKSRKWGTHLLRSVPFHTCP